MIECLRCGKCCILENKHRCRYLITFSNGKTACLVYKRRIRGNNIFIGEVEGLKYYCNLRENVSTSYPNCPYNLVVNTNTQNKAK